MREILELGVQTRVDDNKLFHIRLELSGLVRGEVSLANEKTVSSAATCGKPSVRQSKVDSFDRCSLIKSKRGSSCS